MFMNAEDYVGNIRNLLLNLDNDSTSVFFRTIIDGDVKEIEKTPSEMSAWLSDYEDRDTLYMTFDPLVSTMDVVITEYER
jgi:hypothetical protein